MEGDQTLVRIFIDESARWSRQPLAKALVKRLRDEKFAGVTVLSGVEGFGTRRTLHTRDIELESFDLPVVVEVVESPELVERLKAILDEMVNDGFVTFESVHVLRYLPKGRGKPPP